MNSRSWSERDEQLLRELYATMPLKAIGEQLGRTATAVKQRAKLIGLRRGGRQVWRPEEIETLRRLYADLPTQQIAELLGRTAHKVYAKANTLGLAKSEAYLASPAACRLRRGDNIGQRFQKGHVPWTKGLRRPGYAPGRMKETQFKKGELSGRNLKRYKPLGALRIRPDGYLERKVTHDGRGSQRWKAVHQLVWIEAHGQIPDGHVIAFKPGLRTNVLEEITLDRLELTTLQELMRRNSIHNLPPELKETVQLLGRVRRVINRRTREKQDY